LGQSLERRSSTEWRAQSLARAAETKSASKKEAENRRLTSKLEYEEGANLHKAAMATAAALAEQRRTAPSDNDGNDMSTTSSKSPVLSPTSLRRLPSVEQQQQQRPPTTPLLQPLPETDASKPSSTPASHTANSKAQSDAKGAGDGTMHHASPQQKPSMRRHTSSFSPQVRSRKDDHATAKPPTSVISRLRSFLLSDDCLVLKRRKANQLILDSELETILSACGGSVESVIGHCRQLLESSIVASNVAELIERLREVYRVTLERRTKHWKILYGMLRDQSMLDPLAFPASGYDYGPDREPAIDSVLNSILYFNTEDQHPLPRAQVYLTNYYYSPIQTLKSLDFLICLATEERKRKASMGKDGAARDRDRERERAASMANLAASDPIEARVRNLSHILEELHTLYSAFLHAKQQVFAFMRSERCTFRLMLPAPTNTEQEGTDGGEQEAAPSEYDALKDVSMNDVEKLFKMTPTAGLGLLSFLTQIAFERPDRVFSCWEELGATVSGRVIQLSHQLGGRPPKGTRKKVRAFLESSEGAAIIKQFGTTMQALRSNDMIDTMVDVCAAEGSGAGSADTTIATLRELVVDSHAFRPSTDGDAPDTLLAALRVYTATKERHLAAIGRFLQSDAGRRLLPNESNPAAPSHKVLDSLYTASGARSRTLDFLRSLSMDEEEHFDSYEDLVEGIRKFGEEVAKKEEKERGIIATFVANNMAGLFESENEGENDGEDGATKQGSSPFTDADIAAIHSKKFGAPFSLLMLSLTTLSSSDQSFTAASDFIERLHDVHLGVVRDWECASQMLTDETSCQRIFDLESVRKNASSLDEPTLPMTHSQVLKLFEQLEATVDVSAVLRAAEESGSRLNSYQELMDRLSKKKSEADEAQQVIEATIERRHLAKVLLGYYGLLPASEVRSLTRSQLQALINIKVDPQPVLSGSSGGGREEPTVAALQTIFARYRAYGVSFQSFDHMIRVMQVERRVAQDVAEGQNVESTPAIQAMLAIVEKHKKVSEEKKAAAEAAAAAAEAEAAALERAARESKKAQEEEEKTNDGEDEESSVGATCKYLISAPRAIDEMEEKEEEKQSTDVPLPSMRSTTKFTLFAPAGSEKQDAHPEFEAAAATETADDSEFVPSSQPSSSSDPANERHSTNEPTTASVLSPRIRSRILEEIRSLADTQPWLEDADAHLSASMEPGSSMAATLIEERYTLFCALVAPRCRLFSQRLLPLPVSDDDLDMLIRVGGGAHDRWSMHRVMDALQRLDAKRVKCKDMDDLIQHATAEVNSHEGRMYINKYQPLLAQLFSHQNGTEVFNDDFIEKLLDQVREGSSNGVVDPYLPLVPLLARTHAFFEMTRHGAGKSYSKDAVPSNPTISIDEFMRTFRSFVQTNRRSIFRSLVSNGLPPFSQSLFLQSVDESEIEFQLASDRRVDGLLDQAGDGCLLNAIRQMRRLEMIEARRYASIQELIDALQPLVQANRRTKIIITDAAGVAATSRAGGNDRRGSSVSDRSDVASSSSSSTFTLPGSLPEDWPSDPDDPAHVSRRQVIFTALSAPACLLFSSRKDPIALTDHDLDEIVQLGGGLESTCHYIARLDQEEQRKFFNLERCIMEMNREREFDLVADFLADVGKRARECEADASKISMAMEGGFAYRYLTPDASDPKYALSRDFFDEMMGEEGMGGSDPRCTLLSVLHALYRKDGSKETTEPLFSDHASLLQAIKRDSRMAKKQGLSNYLLAPGRALLSLPRPTSPSSSPSSYAGFTGLEADCLLDLCEGSLFLTLRHCQMLEKAGFVFSSTMELMEALVLTQQHLVEEEAMQAGLGKDREAEEQEAAEEERKQKEKEAKQQEREAKKAEEAEQQRVKKEEKEKKAQQEKARAKQLATRLIKLPPSTKLRFISAAAPSATAASSSGGAISDYLPPLDADIDILSGEAGAAATEASLSHSTRRREDAHLARVRSEEEEMARQQAAEEGQEYSSLYELYRQAIEATELFDECETLPHIDDDDLDECITLTHASVSSFQLALLDLERRHSRYEDMSALMSDIRSICLRQTIEQLLSLLSYPNCQVFSALPDAELADVDARSLRELLKASGHSMVNLRNMLRVLDSTGLKVKTMDELVDCIAKLSEVRRLMKRSKQVAKHRSGSRSSRSNSMARVPTVISSNNHGSQPRSILKSQKSTRKRRSADEEKRQSRPRERDILLMDQPSKSLPPQ